MHFGLGDRSLAWCRDHWRTLIALGVSGTILLTLVGVLAD
jgi:hypothetical protein